MAEDQAPPAGPDLTQGVALADFRDGKLTGHVGDDEVLLVRGGTQVFAVAAHCTHYHGPLADGLVVGDSVRCPWHHACFDLRSGDAVRAPARAHLWFPGIKSAYEDSFGLRPVMLHPESRGVVRLRSADPSAPVRIVQPRPPPRDAAGPS